MRTRLFILIGLCFMMVTMAGCPKDSTYQKSYKTLSGSKATVENLMRTTQQLHETGQVTDEQMQKADEAYDAAQAIQKEFIEAQITVMRGGDKTKEEQVMNLSVAYFLAASRFINLAIEMGVIKSDDPNIKEVS